MKKMLVLLAAVALSTGAAFAQTAASAPTTSRDAAQGPRADYKKVTPEQHADRQAARLTKQLALSADQTAKVRAIALAQAQEAQTLRAQSTPTSTRAGQGQEMKALKEKYDGQLKGVLTADQYAKYTQMQDNKMNKHQQFKGSRIRAKS